MSLLERLDRLETRLNLLEVRLKPLRTIRVQVLDDWAGCGYESSKEVKNVRNAAADGNILEDYFSIKEMEERNPKRAAAWKHAFSRKYEVQYSSCSLRVIETWPKETFEIYNVVANVKKLDRWALRKECDEVINLCKRFLRLFRFGEEGFLNEGSQSLQLLKRIREMEEQKQLSTLHAFPSWYLSSLSATMYEKPERILVHHQAKASS